ncbi:MAG: sigma-70 family RNA polymerase sigma factor [Pyrinomonadaceae bacterium]|nr:sigma-70 family RNA polymerase sigma factor [Pyrinomonadaceae bacterium]
MVAQLEKFIVETLTRCLSRVRNSRGLQVEMLRARVVKTLEKYLLRDEPNASNVVIKEFVESLQLEDLCLIVACERGDEDSWRDLMTNHGATVKSAARKIASNVEDAEDLANSIWAELHGLKRNSDGAISGKLGYYSGRGSLGGWLRAIVAQIAVDLHRKSSRFVQVEDDREFENLANKNQFVKSANNNPEQSFTQKSIKQTVETALQKAMREIEAENRLLLKLYYFDNLNLKQIGATLGYHEATASRKLSKVQTDLRSKIEKTLQIEYGWKLEETKRNLSEAASLLNSNLEKMLTAES